MKRKILWCWLSLLLVAALVLASCGPGEKVVKKGELYGGTLTMWFAFSVCGAEPASPDIADGYFAPLMWLTPIQDKPLMGDIDKYGPRGTGEYEFLLQAFLPEKYMKGHLLESWEVSRNETVWHIRQGIMWQPGYSGIMEARELTAEDVVADLLYFRDAPAGLKFSEMSGDIYTTDKYTVVIETPDFDIGLMYAIGYEDRAIVSPPELVAAGIDKWENQVGTGPFMIKEYVVGSHMAWDRNPDYWDTTTIDGVEYQLPFIDKLIWPIIPDESTQIAALRTGKLDLMLPVPNTYWHNLDATAPELASNRYATTTGHRVGLKCSEPPFDDVNVRRAMMIGTNREAFYDLQDVGELPEHWWPTYTGDPTVYTPLEELPAETRLLYDYNPDLAKQMLADAGYPDGFKTELHTLSQPRFQDRAALLKDIWAKIGVDVEIKAAEYVINQDLMNTKTYTGAFVSEASGGDNPARGLVQYGLTDSYFNWTVYSNPRFDELCVNYQTEMDFVKRNSVAKEAGVLFLNEVSSMPLAPLKEGVFWWPWLKNYYGEVAVADYNFIPIIARIWIDQDLKAEMGK